MCTVLQQVHILLPARLDLHSATLHATQKLIDPQMA